MKYYVKKYGESVFKQCKSVKPDVVLINNESSISPEYVKRIKDECKSLMVLTLGDDPWDSVRWKCNFPHSLKHFDIIFSADPAWNNNIRKVAPQARIFWHFGGYDPDRFFPTDKSMITEEESSKLGCDLAFTGSSYAEKAEGAYRADLLSYLTMYDLKIWGGDNWEYRFQFNPVLRRCFQGPRLSFEQLRILYGTTKIFLNLPAPQVTFGFQPRVFEIAGCRGFQIADNRLLLRHLFSEDELIVFDTIGELKDKVDYYLRHKAERRQIAERLHDRVKSQYTWNHWAKRIITTIKTGSGIEDLDLLLMREDQDELREYLRNA
jgi:spore maturation protein CgeB